MGAFCFLVLRLIRKAILRNGSSSIMISEDFGGIDVEICTILTGDADTGAIP
jgi:hypothetical protein